VEQRMQLQTRWCLEGAVPQLEMLNSKTVTNDSKHLNQFVQPLGVSEHPIFDDY
jgi:hypothetical protein